MVIDEISIYNRILGRPWINKIEAITSALHQKIRYPIPRGGIGQINSDQAMTRRCTAQGLKKSKQLQFTPVIQAVNEAGSSPSRQASSNKKGVTTSQIARMRKSTALESLMRFCDAMKTLYTKDYLRRPTPRDLQRLL
ncbi:unnamed protein product [Prunus armeniaca]